MEAPTDPKELIVWLSEQTGRSYSWMSQQIGRNKTYVQQFLTKDTPRRLDQVDRTKLCNLFKPTYPWLTPDRFLAPDDRQHVVNGLVTNEGQASESSQKREAEDSGRMLEKRIDMHDNMFADVLARLRRLEDKVAEREDPKSRPQKRG